MVLAAPSGKVVKKTPRTIKYSKSSAVITRSSSTSVLNQSDSDNEGEKKWQKRLMRPTISSQNKMARSKSVTLNRKRQSHSTSRF